MANILLETFSYQNANQAQYAETGVAAAGNPSFSTNAPFSTGSSVRTLTSSIDRHMLPLPTLGLVEMYCGFWYYSGSLEYGSSVLANHAMLNVDHTWSSYNTGSSPRSHLAVCLTTTGKIQVRNSGFDGTILGETGPRVFASQRWHFIELYALIDAAAGAYELRIDGNSVLVGTGLVTKDGSASNSEIGGVNIPYQVLGYANFVTGLYVNDTTGPAPNNTFWGPIRMPTLRPDGAGFSTGFTAVPAVPNWQNVDDAASDQDTTYNQAALAGTIDSFTYENLSGVYSPDTIFSIGLNTLSRKEDLPGNKTLRSRLRSNASDALGTTRPQTTAVYNHNRQIIEQDPDAGGIPWTVGAVDAVEAGYEVLL